MFYLGHVQTHLPRQLFWWGRKTTEWTYERGGLYCCQPDSLIRVEMCSDDDEWNMVWWWTGAWEREERRKTTNKNWRPAFNQDGNIQTGAFLTLACADNDDEAVATCENHTPNMEAHRRWRHPPSPLLCYASFCVLVQLVHPLPESILELVNRQLGAVIPRHMAHWTEWHCTASERQKCTWMAQQGYTVNSIHVYSI